MKNKMNQLIEEYNKLKETVKEKAKGKAFALLQR